MFWISGHHMHIIGEESMGLYVPEARGAIIMPENECVLFARFQNNTYGKERFKLDREGSNYAMPHLQTSNIFGAAVSIEQWSVRGNVALLAHAESPQNLRDLLESMLPFYKKVAHPDIVCIAAPVGRSMTHPFRAAITGLPVNYLDGVRTDDPSRAALQ
jgi:hypothetical protein